MSEEKIMVALDCGNSSFRIVAGQYKEGRIRSEVIKQIPNNMVKIGKYYYWDLLHIFHEFKTALKECAAKYEKIDSIGICTWGVDFAFFDREGHMLSNPLSYRNVIGEEQLSKLDSEDKKQMFYDTGILCDKINSLYMMSGMKEIFPHILSAADKCLMVPDILNYFLTGEMVNEPSELSTTQLMSAKERKISKAVCERFEIDENIFCRIGEHGKAVGRVREDILEEIGVEYNIPVICVPSHDTASAVAAIPALEENFGFISCGTWSLIGTELKEPVCSEEVRKANLTNEVGAFGKITLLKNSAGMFIINQLKKEYDFFCNEKTSWDTISALAEKCDSNAILDLNDAAFFNPSSMSKAVWESLRESGQVSGELRWDVLFRTFYDSLARVYAETIRDIEQVTGNKFEKVYIVGGGTASRVLLKLSAFYMKKPIVVCYGESTSMGNLGVQLKYFHEEFTLSDIRRIIAESYKTEIFEL
ncbi:FGGY family carbohydrate kinase [Lachnospiraceae bacterium 42-17]|jgi:rhamnulokinase